MHADAFLLFRFIHRMIYPRFASILLALDTAPHAYHGPVQRSLALFLGTGNATPDLPTIMLERLYTSPTYGMCA